jgi:hypothetical protein
VEEYNETKLETQDQLREFQAFLERSLRGDMTLVDEFGAAQAVSGGHKLHLQHSCFFTPAAQHGLRTSQPDKSSPPPTRAVFLLSIVMPFSLQAIQAAVSDAFKTPEVIRMFAQKQPDQLRLRLASLQRDAKLKSGGVSQDAFQRQAVEILVALKKMGTELTAEESAFLASLSSAAQLESAVDSVGDVTQAGLMNEASKQVRHAEKE